MLQKLPPKLDEKDKILLLELQLDGRQSIAQAAKKARLSPDATNYRIKKYLREGLIVNFYAVPRFERLGFTTYRIYLQFAGSTPEKENEMVDYILERMPCQWLGVCDGRWDVIARISARSVFEFNNMMNAFLERYGSNIKQKEVTIQLRHTWWISPYGLAEKPPGKEPKHEVPASEKVLEHDFLDLRIMSLLVEDARLPTVEIAKRLKASPDTIRQRVKRLVAGGAILRFYAYLNRGKLGYQHNQVFVRFTEQPEEIKKLIAYLNAFPNCFFISSMVGAWDMQFGLDAKNSIEFHEMFGKIKEKFHRVIREHESLIVYREYAPNPFRYFLAESIAKA